MSILVGFGRSIDLLVSCLPQFFNFNDSIATPVLFLSRAETFLEHAEGWAVTITWHSIM